MAWKLERQILPFLAGVLVPTMLMTPVAAQTAPDKKPAHYSVDTTLVGTLLDDPAAVEVLKKMIPTVYANEMFQTMGREQTLRGIQQYEPGPLSDDNLAKIQAEFDKLPPKK